jgi:PAS domain S-box-containing protein
LIDRERNWFKSKYGVDEPYESPRDISFCGHAINTPSELFEVRDARLDNRFFDNPLVTGQLGLNFYAGVPLLDADNFPLGTLCVFDTKPKELTEGQKKALSVLAKEAINRLILRKENLKISKELEIVNQKYFRLYDNAPDMMLSIDPNTKKIIDCNNTLCLKLGYTRNEIIGQDLFFLYHPDYHEKAKLTLIEFKKKGEIVDNRLVIRTKANKKIHVSLNENSIKDKEGSIVQSNSIFRDINELIKIEKALLDTNQRLELKVEKRTKQLKFNKERLELALRGANDGIWDWLDFDSEEQWWSPNYYKLLGYEPNEIESTVSIFNSLIVHPEDLDRIWKSFNKCIDDNVPMNDEYRLKTKSGDYRWFRGKANVLKDDNGKAYRIAGSISDIQQRKSLEIKLKEAQNFLSKVTEIAPSVIYVVNHETKLNEFSNKELGSVLGYSKEEIEKMGIQLIQELCHPKDLLLINNHFTRIQSLKQEEKISIEYRLRHKKGNYIWLHSVDTIFEKNTKGKVIKHIGVATDITSIKESEESLIIQKEILEEQNNDLKQFTYIATHDLKSPILTVQGHFEFLKTQFENRNKDSQESIEMIDEELNKFNNTIQALAEAIKLRENKIDTVKINLNEVFQNLMPYYQNEVKSLNGQISIDIAENSTVLGTSIYIKSIIQNLISNAIKYRSKSRNISINISTKLQGKYILLTIEDNGLGIDLKLHEHRLFKMFNQFHDHSDGSGMGLYMVNYMVNKINGKLNLESKVEVGTKFSILLEKAK